MKKVLIILMLNSFCCYSQSNEQLMREIQLLKQKVNKLEGKNSNGLKVKQFNGATSSNSQQPSSSSNSSVDSGKLNEMMKSIKKGEEHIKQRNKLLEDMENEGL